MNRGTITATLAERAAGLKFGHLTPDAVTVAKQCLLDWLGVTIAARNDPLVLILINERRESGLLGDAVVIGRKDRLALPAAVMVNGAMSHALDYDDVHQVMNGHPTVPVAPVALGLAAQLGADGQTLLTAFVAGFETECRIGALCGANHYARGFHPTGTLGTFGAAAAAGNLLALGPGQMKMAMGIAGTQAAGLKSAFGTHCKPLHAGRAAESGLLAARLAQGGFTANNDIFGDGQGFVRTQSDDFIEAACREDPQGGFHITSTLFKYHAACYLTHASIEALKALLDTHAISPADIELITLRVPPGHMKICAIPEPKTGLEVKFSLRMIAAMVLAGVDTSNDLSYTDELAGKSDLVVWRDKVKVVPDWSGSVLASEVIVELRDGSKFARSHDAGVPMADLEQQWNLLEVKFRSLVIPALGEDRANALITRCRSLESITDIRPMLNLSIQAD